MAEETPQKPPADKKQGSGMQKRSLFGMPQWAVVAGGAMLVAFAYMYWRKKQLAASQSSTSTNADTMQNYPNMQNDPMMEALYAQIQNLQGQVGNLSPQASVPNYSLIPWESTGDTADMSLNALADYVNSTPQAIIDNTKAAYKQNGTGWDFNTSLGQYFDAGSYDNPIPQGYLLYVPILAPPGQGSPLGGQSGDIVPPVATGYYSPPQPAGGF